MAGAMQAKFVILVMTLVLTFWRMASSGLLHRVALVRTNTIREIN
jgi:hypothetical protein